MHAADVAPAGLAGGRLPWLAARLDPAAAAQGTMGAAGVAPARLADQRLPGDASPLAGVPVALALGVGGVRHGGRSRHGASRPLHQRLTLLSNRDRFGP